MSKFNQQICFDRRHWLRQSAAGAASLAMATLSLQAAEDKKPTRCQIACMTLPYSAFPLERALSGIKLAGYEYVAWGTTHQESGGRTPVMPADAPAERAKELARRCRDLGLEPVMMFSTVYPEA